jgi:hypothetical protein
MQREMYTKVNGLRTKQMDMEFILILTEAATKVSGIKTSSTALELSNGLMEPNMKANTNKA